MNLSLALQVSQLSFNEFCGFMFFAAAMLAFGCCVACGKPKPPNHP